MQGGLETPCLLKLETTDDALMSKARTLLDYCQEKDYNSESLAQPSKKIKLEILIVIVSPCRQKRTTQKYG